MEFGPVPIDASVGAILVHSVRAGGRRFRKGHLVSASDVPVFAQAGLATVTVARLAQDDVGEDAAAARIALALTGSGVRAGAAFTGRSNLYAEPSGLLIIDPERLDALNAVNEAITVATLPPFSRVEPGQMIATVKIIPFAVSRKTLDAALTILGSRQSLSVAPFSRRRIALISTVLPDTKPSILDKNRTALDTRLAGLGCEIVREIRVGHEEAELADALTQAVVSAPDVVLVFGARAISDRRDVVPAAIVRNAGRIVHFGMPVDPGNLLLLGEMGGLPVIGLPGCARSPKLNGFDFVLQRILAGVPVGPASISKMGVGGLLSEIPTRPQPRDGQPAPTQPRAMRVAAVILAAGLSSRMGRNKLLETIGEKTLLRRVADAALDSAARPVIVVTGHEPQKAAQSLSGLDVTIVENPDYRTGLSSSLKSGIAAVPEDCDAAMVLLADMPDITSQLIDRLIAAFSPDDSRLICVATHGGKRGNPVLWAKSFFHEIKMLTGDVGAKSLIASHAEFVCEVEAMNEAPLLDIDTPAALAAYLKALA
jgi:molybdenum cofactor cytidylyltransferase